MKKREKDASEMDVVKGSGNVFADLGLPYPEEDLAKAEMAFAIRQRIQAKGLTQTEAAAALHTDQAKVSLVMNGRVSGFTYDRLARFLNALEVDVRIVLAPSADDMAGKTTVTTG